MKDRKTDYGTVILHWLFAAGLGVAFVTGLRIATESPDRQWINFLDAVLPRENVWVPHMQAALVLVPLTLAYAIYLFRSGLTVRVPLDQIRVRGLFGNRQVKLRALNAVLTWALFVTVAAEQFGTNLRATVATTVPNMVRGLVPLFTLLYRTLEAPLGALGGAALIGAGALAIALFSVWAMRETFASDLDYCE